MRKIDKIKEEQFIIAAWYTLIMKRGYFNERLDINECVDLLKYTTNSSATKIKRYFYKNIPQDFLDKFTY